MLFKNNVIRKRVMDAIEQKVAAVEKQYDNELVDLRNTFEAEINSAHERYHQGKAMAEEKAVESIVSKIL